MYDLLHPGQVTWYTMLLLEFKGTLSLLDVQRHFVFVHPKKNFIPKLILFIMTLLFALDLVLFMKSEPCKIHVGPV